MLFGFVYVYAQSHVRFAYAQNSTSLERCNGGNYPVLAGDHEICSYSAQFIGTCTGGDMYDKWTTVNASPAPALNWAITPWENQWIRIIGHEITSFNPNDGHGGWHIGSGYVADIQGGLGAGENHSIVFYPPGHVWMFPPIGYQTGGLAIKDLHGACTAGQPANVQVTFYYTTAAGINVPTPPPPPPPPPPACTTFNTLNPGDKSSHIVLSSGNTTARGDGTNEHALVRAIAGIAPGTGSYHYEITLSGQGSLGTPINIIGLQNSSTPTNTPVGNGGTGFGRGYNPGNGYNYTANFTPAGGTAAVLGNGTYAFDVNSDTGTVKITDPSGASITETLSGTSVTLFPAVSIYGADSGSIAFNFGASPFSKPVPAGYKAGICQ